MGNNVVPFKPVSTSKLNTIKNVSARQNVIETELTKLNRNYLTPSANIANDSINFNETSLKEYTIEELEQMNSSNQILETNNYKTISKNFKIFSEEIFTLGQEISGTLAGALASFQNFDDFKKENEEYFGFPDLDYSPIKEDGYIIQGTTAVSAPLYDENLSDLEKEYRYDYIFITAYSKELYSRIYVYDNEGNFLGRLLLQTDAHVGGITYDQENGIVFVTGENGRVNAYDYSLISETLKEMGTGGYFGMFIEDCGKDRARLRCDNNKLNLKNASTIYYYDGYLYEALFDAEGNGKIAKYKVTYNDDIKEEVTYELEGEIESCPMQVQGIAVKEYKGKTYLITASSLGQKASSVIRIYDITDGMVLDDSTFVGYHYTDPGLEGITINGNNNVTFSSEFNDQYFTTMEDLINNASKTEDPEEIAKRQKAGKSYAEKQKQKK